MKTFLRMEQVQLFFREAVTMISPCCNQDKDLHIFELLTTKGKRRIDPVTFGWIKMLRRAGHAGSADADKMHVPWFFEQVFSSLQEYRK